MRVGLVAADDVNERIRGREVVPPERPNLALAADVPDRHVEVLVLDLLAVEADCRHGRRELAQLELVQDRCLAGRVEAEHEHAGRHVEIEQAVELGDGEAHGPGGSEQVASAACGR